MPWTLALLTSLATTAHASDRNQTVSANLARLTWPAFEGRYERRLAPRHGVEAGLLVGSYSTSSSRSTSAQYSEYQEYLSSHADVRGAGLGYTFYFKDFERGWFAHTDLGLARTDATVWAGEARATLSVTTLTFGPTLGWKRVGERGFTVQADLGVGYGAVLGNPQATYTGSSDTVTQSVRSRKEGGFGWLGGLEVGWSL